MKIFLLVLVSALSLNAQTAPVWTMQSSGSHASLRGIHSVDGKVAWASGSGGTVLRTIDGGEHWTQCATPDAAKDGAKLDFRGVQAWDANTAIIMSSGPGELSRLYKTTDGCKTWKLLFMNSDKDGFWDAIQITGTNTLLMIGDPIAHKYVFHFKVKTSFNFPLYGSIDGGNKWMRVDSNMLYAQTDKEGKPTESIFAASNSSLLELDGHRLILFATGGSSVGFGQLESQKNPDPLLCKSSCSIAGSSKVPLKSGPSAGIFSISARNKTLDSPIVVAVGGDYMKPKDSEGTSATCWRDTDIPVVFKFHCLVSTQPPHGYRSTVEWSEALKLWLTAGTNGSDYSTDDGKTWQPLDDGNWNALSLPYLVGPDGRIARLNEAAFAEKLKPVKSQK